MYKEPHLIYKVRRKGTQTFSAGGSNPKFTRRGKSWTIGDLRKHLKLLTKSAKNIYRTECELVPFSEDLTQTVDLSLKDI